MKHLLTALLTLLLCLVQVRMQNSTETPSSAASETTEHPCHCADMIGMRGSFQFQYCTTEGIASFTSIISNTDLPSFPFGIEISNIQLIEYCMHIICDHGEHGRK
ncbi:UNVERIFIED_CONTAM: hypothetical protein RMT77_000896 [Armadillidium vulgare]